jgi:phage tail sheath protein FI
MPEFLTPGVYYELADAGPSPVRGVRTDIAAFVGIAPRGPLHIPTPMESWRQYQAVFGSFVSYAFLAYAVKGFFENGGRLCYIVRVAGADAEPASLQLKDASGIDVVRIRARNEGTWGNGVLLSLTTINRARGTFTLVVTGPDGDRETFPNLTLGEHDSRNCVSVLAKGDDRTRPSRWISADIQANGVPDPAQSGMTNFAAFLANGKDGLASLTRADFLGTLDDPEVGKRGLGSLEKVSEVAIVAIPDMHIIPVVIAKPDLPPPPPHDPCLCRTDVLPPAAVADDVPDELPPRFSETDIQSMQQALIEHCEKRGDRVAILDAPVHTFGSPYVLPEILEWRSRFDSQRGFATLYYPWVKVLDPLGLGNSPVRAVPPSGHIAGLYAATDADPGVHRAPANERMQWAEDVTVVIDDNTQGVLNPEGINCLRAFPGRGILVYGARTVSSDQDWRYISVRRLLIMIEKAIDLSTQWAVFEPHNAELRQKLVQSISSFLESIWQRAMLAGATREEAYFVKCDGTNNPPASVDAGRIITDVGVAPAVPAEFVIFRVGRTVEELEIVER